MKRLILLFMLMLVLTACGGGGNSSPAENDKTIASVALADGNKQTATVGTELPNPLVALILNKAGLPIAGQVVNFKVVTGGGTVFAGAATSDSNGFARERWTLGTLAGAQKVEVRAVDSAGTAVVYATFDAIGVAGAPQSVSIASGNSQSSQQLQPLPLPVKVIVKDTYGNPAAGVSVVFTADNGGSALPGSAMTDVLGEAAATWTMGQVIGTQTLSAVVAGLAPVSFSATATRSPPSAATTIVKISGDSQTIVQHSLIPTPFQTAITDVLPIQVAVIDVLGNPVPGTQVTFSAHTGSGYVRPATTITDSQGKASWTGYIHTAGLQKIDASVAGIPTVTFSTNVTASEHMYDGVYDCQGVGLCIAECYELNSVGTTLTIPIINGLLDFGTSTGWFGKSGTLTEVDGKLNVRSGGYNFTYNYTELAGQLVVDPLQRATGAGTSTELYGGMQSHAAGTPTGRVGNWTCDRR